jgi:hypothetical protein
MTCVGGLGPTSSTNPQFRAGSLVVLDLPGNGAAFAEGTVLTHGSRPTRRRVRVHPRGSRPALWSRRAVLEQRLHRLKVGGRHDHAGIRVVPGAGVHWRASSRGWPMAERELATARAGGRGRQGPVPRRDRAERWSLCGSLRGSEGNRRGRTGYYLIPPVTCAFATRTDSGPTVTDGGSCGS